MVKVAKLVSGEFVIGNVVETTLSNVMLISFNVDHKTGIVVKKLIPYMFPISNSLGKIITLDKIICFENADQELLVNYLKSIQNFIKENTRGENVENNSGSNAISIRDQDETTKSNEPS